MVQGAVTHLTEDRNRCLPEDEVIRGMPTLSPGLPGPHTAGTEQWQSREHRRVSMSVEYGVG